MLKHICFLLFLISHLGYSQSLNEIKRSICKQLLYKNAYSIEDIESAFKKGLDPGCKCIYNSLEESDPTAPNGHAMLLDVMPIMHQTSTRQVLTYDLTLLELAIRRKDHELIQLLLKNGQSINDILIMGEHPLTAEIKNLTFEDYFESKGYEMIDYMINYGADPIMGSLEYLSDKKVIRELTARGMDINTLRVTDYLRMEKELNWLLDQGFVLRETVLDEFDNEWIIEDSMRLVNFVNRGFNIDTNNLLLVAAKKKNWKMVKQLLALGADPNQEDQNGKTIIYEAVANNDLALVKDLLHRGAHYQARKLNTERSLLSIAVEVNRAQLVKYLLSRNIDPNYPHKKQKHYPLVLAYQIHNDTIIQMLVDHGANFDVLIGGKYDYRYFMTRDPEHKLLKKWIQRGLKVEMMVCSDGTFLHRAIRENNQEMIELLLPALKNVNVLGSDHDSPLNCALKYNQIDLAFQLLKMGASVNIADETFNKTALNHAIALKNKGLIHAILERQPKINAASIYVHPLYKAVKAGHISLVIDFIHYGYLPTEEMMPEVFNLNNREIIKEMLLQAYVPTYESAIRILEYKDLALVKLTLENGYDLNSPLPDEKSEPLRKHAKKLGCSKEIQEMLKPLEVNSEEE